MKLQEKCILISKAQITLQSRFTPAIMEIFSIGIFYLNQVKVKTKCQKVGEVKTKMVRILSHTSGSL